MKQKNTKKLIPFTAIPVSLLIPNMTAYASYVIGKDKIRPSDFDNMNTKNAVGYILGTVFAILRIVGVVTLMWGIYSIVAAKKDGDASEMATAWTKIIFGLVFLLFPTILKTVGIIA